MHHLKGRCVPKSWLQYPVIRRHLDEALSTKGISACSTQRFCLVLIPTQTRTRNIFWQLESWIVSTLLATLSWLAILKRHLYLKNWEYLYENGSMGFKDYVREDAVVENHWFLDPLKHIGSVYPACRQLCKLPHPNSCCQWSHLFWRLWNVPLRSDATRKGGFKSWGSHGLYSLHAMPSECAILQPYQYQIHL